jgi:LuxR family transcriptional regulator, maltose regulon positive regulatory protein
MIPNLLKTKLSPPVVKSRVHRLRLLNKLQSAHLRKLILIAAPVGFGKTTLATEWLSTLKEPVAWLLLDEGDDEPTRFMAYLIAALQQVDSRIGQGLSHALYELDIDTVLVSLLNDLTAFTEDSHLFLVLDDYHVLDNPQIDHILLFMVEHLPAHVHLVLLSRIDPPLPLPRLRARQTLLEIREHELRFTPDEAAQLFTDSLPNDTRRAIYDKTEGWAAGLQLAALAADDAAFIETFTGTHRYIMDYLMDEVFGRQPAEVQGFLLQTSILNRMCASLCKTIREQNDNQRILEYLDQAHLFIVPLDSERAWYRYHHLFADVLRQRLQHQMPDLVPVLHRRASQWYAQFAHEDPHALQEALYHAVHDPTQIAELLHQFGDGMWERGEHESLRQWLNRVPSAQRTAKLHIFAAWLDFTAGHYTQAESHLQKAEGDTSSAEAIGRIAVVRAFLTTFAGQFTQTVEYALTALKLLESGQWRASAAIALGDAYSLSSDYTAAINAYQDALNENGNSLYLTLNIGFKLASVQRQRGMLHQAYTICSEHIAAAERHGLAQTAMAGCLYALRGEILCEWNQLGEALAQTQQGIDASHTTKHIGLAAWAHLYRARCLLSARDFQGVEAVIQRLEALGSLPPWVVSPLAAMRALSQLGQGNISAVGMWIRERGLTVNGAINPAQEFEYIVFSRLLYMQGHINDAQNITTQLLDLNAKTGRANVRLILLILQTLIYQSRNEAEQATDTFREALILGAIGNSIRPFLEAGDSIVPLIRAAPPSDYTRSLLDAFKPSPQADENPINRLSEREHDVLRLIAEGFRNQDIADSLFISLNTVLYHTKNIYSKLYVANRTQAIQRGREMGLL